ncbi:DUF721 domain-containing protein [Camelimonas abortus]|uniref:DUF721 domain-containing protein n=1 Tax=Camelimonas abortus TaxID=1017184 RepID=A0ABV7LEK9_9HYPH
MSQPRQPARDFQPQPLAELIDQCLDQALAARGFAASDILLAWEDIVGARLASHTRPLRISWPRQSRHGEADSPATLEVRAGSAFAVELQHMAPVIIDRINQHFGWRCVGRIVIRQGPAPSKPQPAPPRAPDPQALRRAADLAAPIADERLRAAVARLGAAVLDRRG